METTKIQVPKDWPAECGQPKECRAVSLGSQSTLIAWTGPAVDRQGNVDRSGNPNKFTTTWHCRTCGRSWTEELEA